MQTLNRATTALLLGVLSLALVLLGGSAADMPEAVTEEPGLERPRDTAQPASLPDSPHSSALSTLINVSGTITGPSGPVPNVWVGVNTHIDWQTDTTDSNGVYSITIEAENELLFHVRPDDATGLAQANRWRGGITGDVTQDFTLVPGHLLDLQVTGTGGQVITEQQWLNVLPLVDMPPDEQWYQLEWHPDTYHYRARLPADIHYVSVQDPPDGYYETTQSFDLRTSDVTTTLPLNTSFVSPIPYEPPDAGQIAVGAPDLLGEAVVTGGPGATLPLARVLLVNLHTAHQVHTVSEADGSFNAQIYAPPGSALMIKHGPASYRWSNLEVGVSEMLNPFPGTIINVEHAHTASAPELPFAAVGAFEQVADDIPSTPNYVGAAWAITGTLGPVVAEGEWTRVFTGTYDGATVPGLYLGGLNWTHPALGDLDGDGAPELIVGEQYGHLVLYQNVGSAATPDWEFVSANFANVDTGDWAYPALADVTDDGAIDLFVGTGDGTVAIYYNDGSASVPEWPPTPDVTLSANSKATPALDDLDDNGLLDLVVGCQSGTLTHFENTGTATAPVWTQRTSSYADIDEGGWLQPAFLDLDGDDDRDMLIGRGGDMIWYRRGGTPSSPTWTRVDADPIGYGFGSSATSPGTGDWNGDGETDLVIGEHWGALRFFWIDPPDSWTETSFKFPFELSGDTAPALADWNDDDTLDLLLGQAHGRIEQYTNTGTTSEADWQPDGVLLTLPWTNHPHAFPAFADVDTSTGLSTSGDGLVDLFVGEGSWGGPDAGGNIRHYQNSGTPSAPNWTLVVTNFLGLDTGGWATPAFADLDDDGDLDLLAGSGPGALTFVEKTPTGWAAPISPYLDFELGAYTAPAFFDVDQDGDLDLLVGREDGKLAYVRNVGTASVPAWELVTTSYAGIDVGEHAVPTSADVDGDGDDDLLIGEGDGGLNLYRYEGPGTPPTGDTYAPGEDIQVKGTLRLHSQAITATADVESLSASVGFDLLMTHDADGKALPVINSFMSTVLSPSGLPVQGGRRPTLDDDLGGFSIEDFHYVGGHTVEANFLASFHIPSTAPAGLYRPLLHVWGHEVPIATEWLAANVTRYTFLPEVAALPPIQVGEIATPRLVWRLLNDTYVQGTRGTGAREDADAFGLSSQIVTQGAPFYAPLSDLRTGKPITYRLEPFMPMISFTDRRMPTPPLLPFDLPGGSLHVAIEEPDGTMRDLGSEPFAQSFNRTPTTRGGEDLNTGTVQQDDVYSLKAASDRFRVTFDQYGHHVVTMTGEVQDLWGTTYTGGGTYDLWIAEPLDVHPGVLPGTPLAVGDAFNPALRIYPRVPADVRLRLTLYPDSDPTQAVTHTLSGQANRLGYFGSDTTVKWEIDRRGADSMADQSTNPPAQQAYEPASLPITLTAPGEYRIDLTATYTDADGTLYRAAMTWGGVVMPPEGDADLVVHGRRGVDSLTSIPEFSWFVSCRDLSIDPSAISHTYNPYFNGDVVWSRMEDTPGECPAGVRSGGDSLVLGASVQDTTGGTIEAAIESRAERMSPPLTPPGDLTERVSAQELPLFFSTRSGRPPQLTLGRMDASIPEDVDQIAYSYRSSQRPGVRVREFLATDGESGGYWRLDTLYDDQLGVGVLGDQPNDFKFQYIGTVYRDLETGHAEYGGQGTGWIFIPEDDPAGSRVMPPFAGPGNGGWTNEGGPLLTLKGEDIHIFILPTGVRPGEMLEVGDRFRFAGHVMPTLDSQVAVTVTAPSEMQYLGGGQANAIGYFYNSDDDFVINEPGLWAVDVRVWHDGQCSGGQTIAPYPTGDVLGSEEGRYWFYVAPEESPLLDVSSPSPGYLPFDYEVKPITITGSLPTGLSGTTIDYTISMPGYILEHDQITPDGDTYQIVFDPVALHEDFPNLDLLGRDSHQAGLADTVAIGLLLQGESGGSTIYRANAITLQGEQVFVSNAPRPDLPNKVYLPAVLRGS